MGKAESEGSRAQAEADGLAGGTQENRGGAESQVGEVEARSLS